MAQALLDLRRSAPGWGHGAHPRLHGDTQAWFLADDTSWPLSFLSICDLFGWNPGAVRAEVFRPGQAPDPVRHLRLVRRR